MINCKKFLLIFFLSFSYLFVNAQVAKYSNEFLSLGIGARGLAMANTLTSLADDVTAAYWNPAGLVRMERPYQLAAMHAEYFAGIAKYDYIGAGYRIDNKQAVAITWIRFGVDNIMNTTELIDNQGNVDYNRISYFSAADNAFLLSYAYNFENIKGLSVGANAKIIRRTIGKFAGAWGFGLDAGVQYNIKGWQMGAMLKDVTSTFNAWTYDLSPKVIEVFEATGNEIPTNTLELTLPKLNLGAGKYVEFGKGFNGTFALDFDCTFDRKRNTLIRSNAVSIDPHFGMEFAYKTIVALRAGIGNFQQVPFFDGKNKFTCQINFGIGIGIKDIVFIDYAFTDLGSLSIALPSHVFSLKVTIESFKRKK
ncbi:MAG: PorV/PorQ family protein [Bacteroidetes bacterium]|nr:PorV/PorQ family protein [Bacteroidota bacterium]MCL2303603.1 PorV/PorQ family protein [Lentimicrobiaceae bacterium]